MRSRLVLLAVIAALSAWLWAGVHRHVATETTTPCATCTVASQTVAPPAAAAVVHHGTAWAALLLASPRVAVPDGRETYRQAPKSSPPRRS